MHVNSAHCKTLHFNATHFNAMQHISMQCSTFQSTTLHYNATYYHAQSVFANVQICLGMITRLLIKDDEAHLFLNSIGCINYGI